MWNINCGISLGRRWRRGYTESWNGSSWITRPNITIARSQNTGCGTITNALGFGGYGYDYPEITTPTLKWNGSTWSNTTAYLLAVNMSPAGFGDVNNAIKAGGSPFSGFTTVAEKWNGSNWTTTTSMPPDGSGDIVGVGTANDGFAYRCYYCNKWNGSNWATTTNTSYDYLYSGGFGTSSSALICGYGTSNHTELWNNTSWTTASNMNAGQQFYHSGSGNTNDGAVFMGYQYTTEIWKGTVVPPQPTGVSSTDGTYSNKIVITWPSVSTATKYKVSRELIN